MNILEHLFTQQDETYRPFQCKLIPTVEPERVIGVRTPALRALARQMRDSEEAQTFLKMLPHVYLEENLLHAFLIAQEKDFQTVLSEVEHFLPFVDNWAVCDQLRPKVFSRHRQALLLKIRQWLSDGRPYVVRFAVEMLMCHYLDTDFDSEYLQWVSVIRSEEYYVNMMIAWYFATALAKRYDAVLPYLQDQCLSPWVHNKSIQKAVESYRITPEQKTYLKTLKIK